MLKKISKLNFIFLIVPSRSSVRPNSPRVPDNAPALRLCAHPHFQRKSCLLESLRTVLLLAFDESALRFLTSLRRRTWSFMKSSPLDHLSAPVFASFSYANRSRYENDNLLKHSCTFYNLFTRRVECRLGFLGLGSLFR